MELGLCLEMIFTKDPLEERMHKAARAGLRNVEIWFTDMTWKQGPEELAAAAKRTGVRVTNTVIGSPDGAIGGGLTDPANRPRWLERARATLDFNRRAGIPATIVCTGNTVPGQSPEATRRSVLEGLKQTARLAEQAGVTLLLEVLNTRVDHAGYWLSSSDEGARLCREVGSERLRLLFDVYHLQVQEGDVAKHIEANLDVIGHFHSAGVPGRHELHEGELNYAWLLPAIERMGYRGIFAMEYSPSIDDERSLAGTLERLGGADRWR
jgi:hydroxypyruvate isomerase